MTTRELLTDAFDRVADTLRSSVSGLEPDELLWRPGPDANSIGWLAWHLTRVQDDHLAGIGGTEQVWRAQDFASRFGLPYPDDSIGYGQSNAQVAEFDQADAQLLIDYQDAVHQQTQRIIDGLGDADYSRVIDKRWDPPVTVSVRLVSVLGDTLQHLGQIGYIKGLYASRS